MSENNPEMKPKGSEGEADATATDNRLNDLLEEIAFEPELTDPRVAARPTAIARLDDADLVQQVLFELRTGGPVHGPAYRQLFDDLWLYAWPVLKAFLRTNRMNQLVRRYLPGGVAISPEDMVTLHRSEAERDALAIDVISRAVIKFEKNAVLGQRWSPTGKASLRTWFIGTCALNFPRAYVRWSAERTDRLTRMTARDGIDVNTLADQIVSNIRDPADIALDRAALRELLANVQPDTKFILGRIMQGSTYQDIADELRWDVGAVTLRIYRLRKRIRLDQERAQRYVDDLDVKESA